MAYFAAQSPPRSALSLAQRRSYLMLRAPLRPRERRGPRRIVWQARRRAALEQKLDHPELTELCRPAERRRREVIIARGQIRAGVQKLFRLSHVAISRRRMKRSDPEPVVLVDRPVLGGALRLRRGPIGEQQLLHALVWTPFPRHPERVAGAFHRRIRKRP